jgi:hypothetical protein
MLLLSLDNAPGSAFRSNANEPWRAGNGWSSRACAVAWGGGAFVAADEVGKQLWRFDPWHTGFQETPWPKLTEPGALDAPRGVAAGDTLAWVLDGDRVRELRDGELSAEGIELPGLPDASGAVALAAIEDGELLVAMPDRVLAFIRGSGGRYVALWEAAGIGDVAGIAASGSYVAVSERDGQRVSLLDTQTGASLARIGDGEVPDGWKPGAIAAQGRWVLVADDANQRIVRLRVTR